MRDSKRREMAVGECGLVGRWQAHSTGEGRMRDTLRRMELVVVAALVRAHGDEEGWSS
jgi:hypothetical protein